MWWIHFHWSCEFCSLERFRVGGIMGFGLTLQEETEGCVMQVEAELSLPFQRQSGGCRGLQCR